MNREQAQILLHSSAHAFKILLKESDLKVAIPESLRIIGEGASADRSYLFNCFVSHSGERLTSQKYEWIAKSVTPQIDNPDLQNLPIENFQPFFDTLLKGESFFGVVRQMSAEMQEVLQPQGIKSLVICPIMANGNLWGFVGFDACNEERIWNEDERSILFSYSASLGSAIERSEIEAALLEAKNAAEAANRAKTTFIANVSHEIRTPLNAILGFSELISDRELDSQTRRYVTAIKTAGDSLLSLINTILDLSKMDAYKLSLFPEPMSIRKILTEFETIFGLRAREKGLIFEIAPPAGIPEALFLDPARVRQILFNLVGNSIKFTEHGFIRLEASAQPTSEGKIDLRMVVQDSGIGISKETQESLFKAFTQASAEGSRKYGGTGLGLTITKRLIGLMGGTLEVDSELGKGTRFTVTLPNVQVVTPPSRSEEERLRARRFKSAKLLLVEDNKPNRLVVQGYLKESGITVVEAEDGEQGVEMAIALSPDLILMDMQMPVMDGKEAFDRIRALPLTSAIPIIAATANSLDLDDGTLKTKFDGYLEKPFTKAQLFAQLARFLPFEASCSDIEAAPGGPEAEPPAEKTAPRRLFANAQTLAADFMEAWKTISALKSIDDIAAFAAKIIEKATPLGDREAISWAETVSQACQDFNLPAMESLFNDFPMLVGAEAQPNP